VKSGPHCCGDLKLFALDGQVIGTAIDFKVSLRNQKRRVSLEFRLSEVQLWLTKFSRWETIQNHISQAFKLNRGSRLVLSVIDWDQAEIMMYVRYTWFRLIVIETLCRGSPLSWSIFISLISHDASSRKSVNINISHINGIRVNE
jgi:hypothetical protein